MMAEDVKPITQETIARLRELQSDMLSACESGSIEEIKLVDRNLGIGAIKNLPALLDAVEQRDAVRTVNRGQRERLASLLEAAKEVTKQRDKLLRAMRNVERFRKETGMIACPWCGENKTTGHKEGCEWVEAMG